MTLESSLLLSGALFLFCAAPGPGVIAVTARSLGAGFRPAASMAVGMTAGDLFYLAAALFGLSAVGRHLGELFFWVRMAGSGYLVFLGLKMALRPPQAAHAPASAARRHGFWAGFAVSLGNPKVILFYLGFLPAFIDLPTLGAWGAAAVMALVALVIGGTLLGYAFLGGRARRLLKSPATIRRVHRTAGAMMIGAGLAVAAES
jgi:threonine/homoserine/homoserine lactone efflux protein